MSRSKALFAISQFIWLLSFSDSIQANDQLAPYADRLCTIVRNKFSLSQPHDTYTLLYGPVRRGNLIVWSATATLPSADYRCEALIDSSSTNTTVIDSTSLALNLSKFVTKVEWTYYDVHKDVLSLGLTVHMHKNASFLVDVGLDKDGCRHIKSVSPVAESLFTQAFRSTCADCSSSSIKVIEQQIRQILDTKLEPQLRGDLHWHLSKAISNN